MIFARLVPEGYRLDLGLTYIVMFSRLVPEGYRLDSCKTSDAQIISDNWKFSKGEESVRMIKRMINRLPAGLYRNILFVA